MGLVAPNGTGKSTLLRCITGLLPAEKGTITIAGQDIWRQRAAFLRQLFFIESSESLFERLTAREHLEYAHELWHGELPVAKVLEIMQMTEYADKRVGKMSLGMKQHVLLGMYLAAGTPVMLFDEPLNGLDPSSIKLFTEVFTHLRDTGTSIMMSSHQLENITAMANRVLFLKDQQLVMGTMDAASLTEQYERLYPTSAVSW